MTTELITTYDQLVEEIKKIETGGKIHLITQDISMTPVLDPNRLVTLVPVEFCLVVGRVYAFEDPETPGRTVVKKLEAILDAVTGTDYYFTGFHSKSKSFLVRHDRDDFIDRDDHDRVHILPKFKEVMRYPYLPISATLIDTIKKRG